MGGSGRKIIELLEKRGDYYLAIPPV